LQGFNFSFKRKQNAEMTEIKKVNRQLDEELIRKTEAAYDRSWQQGDIEGLMACFADDALLISPRDDVAFGAGQIRNLLSAVLRGEARSTKHKSHINRISFISDEVVVADGEAFIEGSQKLSATDAHHRFTDILVRKGDAWLIAQIRAYGIV
jgi:uncharacterized protein (TIGR02246 family)